MAQNTQRRHDDSKTARRGPGEGTVDLLPSGLWRVRLPTPEGRRTATFATPEEAEKFRAGAAAILADPRVATALRARDATGPVRLMLALRLAAAVAHAITTLATETR